MTYPPPPPGSGGPTGGYAPTGLPPAPGYGAPGGYVPPSPPRPGISTGVIVAGGVAVAALILIAAFVIVRLQGGSSRVDLTRAELRDAALVADDVDAGEDVDPSGEAIRSEDVDSPTACRSLIADFEDDDRPISLFGIHDGDVEVLVANTDTVASQFLISDAADLLDGFRELIERCDRAEYDTDATSGTVSYRELDDVDVGDDSVAFEYEIDTDDGTPGIRAAIVVWERNGNGSELGVANLDGVTFVDPDIDLLEDLAETLDDRLAEAVDAAR